MDCRTNEPSDQWVVRRTNGLSDQWAVGPMGCRTNGPRTSGPSDQWVVGRTNGPSDQWAVGLMGRRTIGPEPGQRLVFAGLLHVLEYVHAGVTVSTFLVIVIGFLLVERFFVSLSCVKYQSIN